MNKNFIHSLTWEASQKLCGNVDFLEAINDFFIYLKQYIPLKLLIIGKFDKNNFCVNLLSVTTKSETQQCNYTYKLNSKQRQVILTSNFFETNESELIYIENKDHYLAPLYQLKEIKALNVSNQFPIITLRIIKNKKIYGGPTFLLEKDAIITNDLKLLFELLKAPITIFINAFFQYMELHQFQYVKNNAVKSTSFYSTIVGTKGGLKKLIEQVETIAPLDVPVMIRGETGTGKELIANLIHKLSFCSDKPFVAVNCGAIVPDLIASEFFGHVKGAFTGAFSNHKGLFEQANRGTLFLDEVAELPLSAQVHLLRVLQEHSICKVGDTKPIPVNFRLITATHRPLEEMVKLGTFREDLYYRLNVISINVPPLRKRKEDIPFLLDFFINESIAKFDKNIPKVTQKELNKLCDYNWPGNIRQLQNIVTEAVALYKTGELTFNLSESKSNPIKPEKPLSKNNFPNFHSMVKKYFEEAIVLCNGKITGRDSVAELTQLPDSTLKGKLDKYNIPYGKKAK